MPHFAEGFGSVASCDKCGAREPNLAKHVCKDDAAAERDTDAQRKPPQGFGFGKTAAPKAPPAFGFGAAAASKPAAAPAFGFGKTAAAPPPVANAAGFGGAATKAPAASAGSLERRTSSLKDFSWEELKPAALERTLTETPVDSLPPLAAEGRHTGPLWEMESFNTSEVANPCILLDLNDGFLKSDSFAQLKERASTAWVTKCAAETRGALKHANTWANPNEPTTRVILADAARTFNGLGTRKQFAEFLFMMRLEFGHYGQSMSFVAGVIRLLCSEEDTAAVLRQLNTSVIPLHWASTPVGFVTSAYVIDGILAARDPEAHACLAKLGLMPEIYMARFVSALGVHVLKFKQLFDYIDGVMADGFAWLVKFQLAIVAQMRDQLLKLEASQLPQALNLLRLEATAVKDTDAAAIFDKARGMDLGDALSDVAGLRARVYEAKVAPRLAS